MMTTTTKIPLKIGQQFKVAEKGAEKYVFTVKGVIEPEGDNPIFTAFADDANGKRVEHMIWGWATCSLLFHARRGEVSIRQ